MQGTPVRVLSYHFGAHLCRTGSQPVETGGKPVLRFGCGFGQLEEMFHDCNLHGMKNVGPGLPTDCGPPAMVSLRNARFKTNTSGLPASNDIAFQTKLTQT